LPRSSVFWFIQTSRSRWARAASWSAAMRISSRYFANCLLRSCDRSSEAVTLRPVGR
jgi:hypothetical protein